MTFCVLIGHEQKKKKKNKGIINFIRRVPPSAFVLVTFVLAVLRKGYFLRQRLKRYQLLMEEIAVLMLLFFYIRLQASRRISVRNRFVYDEWIYCSSILC